jgi:hypothetical protein
VSIPDEAAATAWIRELWRLEQRGDRTTLAVGPYTAFIVIGVLQLATRHPRLPPGHRLVADEFIGQLRTLFDGTPGAAMIAAGDEPARDVPQDPP